MFFPFGFGFDRTMIFVLPALLFALWAQWKVRSTFNAWARVRASNDMTGREMARQIMLRNGVTDVGIEAVPGELSDHYDPGSRTVRLSASNYGGDSISSIAVAAHEVGHVLQHHEGYLPLAFRASIAPAVGFASAAAWPLFIVGLLIGPRLPLAGLLMDLGIAFFAGAVLFHLVTLPVEIDASKRALAQLTSTGAIQPQEIAGARAVLGAAALTYVAAAAMAILQLVRVIVLRNDRR